MEIYTITSSTSSDEYSSIDTNIATTYEDAIKKVNDMRMGFKSTYCGNSDDIYVERDEGNVFHAFGRGVSADFYAMVNKFIVDDSGVIVKE